MERCGAVRRGRQSGTAYTSPCQLPAGHEEFHVGRQLSTGEEQRWMWADDPRANRGRVLAVAVDLSDERLAAVVDQWREEL